jgi:hypothetical protein
LILEARGFLYGSEGPVSALTNPVIPRGVEMFAIPRFDVEFTPSTRILRGLDEIAAYLKVHRRTIRRWIDDSGLPAMQSPSGAWFTSTSLLDLWIIAASKAQRAARTRQVHPEDLDYGGIDTFLG